jgi:hypothetical protein
MLPVQCCGLLVVACTADSARCGFGASATNGRGTFASTAGSCASCSLKSGMVICGSGGRPVPAGPLKNEDSFARACRKRVATIANNHVRKNLEAGSLNRVLQMGYLGEARGEVPPEP